MNLGHWGGNNGELKIRLGSGSLPVFNISLISVIHIGKRMMAAHLI